MTNNNKTTTIVGVLFNLYSVEGNQYFYQNFWTENDGIFLFNNQEYSYLPIEYDPPERNISLDNTETSIRLPAVPLIIENLEANNYFINAVIEPYIIEQNFPNVPVLIQDKMVVSSYSIQESGESGAVELIISAPFNTVNGRFPNLFYTTGFGEAGFSLIGYIPEVPLNNNITIN